MPRGGVPGNRGNPRGQQRRGYKHRRRPRYVSGKGLATVLFILCPLCKGFTRPLERFRALMAQPVAEIVGRKQAMGGYGGLAKPTYVTWAGADRAAVSFLQELVVAMEERLREVQSKTYRNLGPASQSDETATRDSHASPARERRRGGVA